MLREKLALYGSALTLNDQQITWFSGREKITLMPKQYKQLCMDAKRARLTTEKFSWLTVVQHAFFSCPRWKNHIIEDPDVFTEEAVNPIISQMNTTFFPKTGQPSFDLGSTPSLNGTELVSS
ncbi:MAG: hypothetical protein LRY69_01270 [Gammaproteobacteria bacterium]|nr:hypothetical protein [Gammaproteobacteria bacterium]